MIRLEVKEYLNDKKKRKKMKRIDEWICHGALFIDFIDVSSKY